MLPMLLSTLLHIGHFVAGTHLGSRAPTGLSQWAKQQNSGQPECSQVDLQHRADSNSARLFRKDSTRRMEG